MFVKDRTETIWISYGFIHFAYALLLLTPLFIKRGSASYIYSRPIYAITISYFLTELITGITLILRASVIINTTYDSPVITFFLAIPDSFSHTVIIHVILTGIFLAWLISNLIANEHTANSVQRRKMELQYVKESSSRINSILRQVTNKPAAKKIERVYDLIHSSPVKSSTGVHSLEEEIIDNISLLENAVKQDNIEQVGLITDKIQQLAENRNNKLKLLN
jgi:hypothetical protein